VSATSRITLERIEAAARVIDPVFLHTPHFVAESLGRELGLRLAVKLETLNPIRSFKGRGADWLVAQAQPGVPLCCASAGNFGQAMAYACRKRQLPLTVYASTRANPLKLQRIRELGAQLTLHGADFDEAKNEARQAATKLGARFVEDSLDVETVEGAGTMGLEWLQFPDPLDAMILALGNGAMLNGVGRVLKARRPQTRVLAVQSAGAPAMVESWRAGRLVAHPHAQTIADGIAVRVPIPEALADMNGIVDDAWLVQDESILRAMRLIYRHLGLEIEPSGAAGLAALLEDGERFRGQFVGLVLCGGNLTEEQKQQWLHA
jgi:threonine dehydratase